MKLKATKKTSEIVLEGITFDLDIVDGSINAVSLKDAKGNFVRIAMRSYSLYVEIPAAPELKKVYQLTGTLCGLEFNETFDDRYLAESKLQELEGKVESDAVKLTIDERMIPVGD